MKKINVIWILLVTFSFSACSDWFDISPKTEVKSKDLFLTEAGFKSALTGIYGMMTREHLYGRDLSFLFLEQLAQRYDNNPDATDEQRGKIYDYENLSSSKEALSSIWNSMYRNIANINNLLYNIEMNGKNIITPGYYELIKGEALALRAFHYFDLLRMWGPIYQLHPTDNAVPFRDQFNADKTPLMKANELLEKIIADLKEAENLLQDDPMDYLGNPNQPFVGFRQQRMNKYAAKALLARAYLYQGDETGKIKAAEKAKEVIDSCGLLLVRNNREDRTMFDETLFGLNVFNMSERITPYFTAAVGQNGTELWISLANAKEVFEVATCGINDIRYKNGYGFIHNDTKLMCRKYLKGTSLNYEEKIPLIRLSEMYYI
ncbi:MAG: RagB/SusD family nutrient uptake outer membrane protein, partial [Odoribacter sp.]